ncbi:MAG: epoxide hydrolase [Myxococcota bacterium]
MMTITPFHIDVPETVLTDLKERLDDTRWPDEIPGAGWDYGTNLDYIKGLVSYWRNDYDWRVHERMLNGFPQFKAEVDGLGIHFAHVKGKGPNPFPVIISHGWPGSFFEMYKVIGPLTDPAAHGGDPADAFDVVCPSLPGYGFSSKPTVAGWNVQRIADAWSQLMQRLGYPRYFAQGGDWGSMVTTAIGQRDPEHCAAIHLNMPIAPPDPETMNDLSATEQGALASMKHYQDWDSGYSKQQSTRPQTLGYGLTDSPSGQAAWILEKFWSWMDCDGHPENVVSRDELLDNVMLYWLPGTAASSARLYWESFGNPPMDPVQVPVGASIFPKEIMRTSKRWAEKHFGGLLYWNELDKGGHFAAFEQPETFVTEVRNCFRSLR